VSSILSQSKHSVTVELSPDYTLGTGDVVVTSAAGVVSTLTGGFTFESGTLGIFRTDFESGLPTYWTSAGDCFWRYLRFCSSLPCSTSHNSAPAVGYGGTGDFALAESAADDPMDAELIAYFNSEGCTDSVTSVSLYYHMYTQRTDCRGSLRIQAATKTSNAWTTVATAATFQTSQGAAWLPLTHTFSDPEEVTGTYVMRHMYCM
jgi:hypothetical protein